MLKATMKAGWVRLALAVLGSLIYALGINLFVTPLGLYTGGLMGFCQLLRTVILTLPSTSPAASGSGRHYLLCYQRSSPGRRLEIHGAHFLPQHRHLRHHLHPLRESGTGAGPAPGGRHPHQLPAGRRHFRRGHRAGAHLRLLWRRTGRPGPPPVPEGRQVHHWAVQSGVQRCTVPALRPPLRRVHHDLLHPQYHLPGRGHRPRPPAERQRPDAHLHQGGEPELNHFILDNLHRASPSWEGKGSTPARILTSSAYASTSIRWRTCSRSFSRWTPRLSSSFRRESTSATTLSGG